MLDPSAVQLFPWPSDPEQFRNTHAHVTCIFLNCNYDTEQFLARDIFFKQDYLLAVCTTYI